MDNPIWLNRNKHKSFFPWFPAPLQWSMSSPQPITSARIWPNIILIILKLFLLWVLSFFLVLYTFTFSVLLSWLHNSLVTPIKHIHNKKMLCRNSLEFFLSRSVSPLKHYFSIIISDLHQVCWIFRFTEYSSVDKNLPPFWFSLTVPFFLLLTPWFL